MRIVTADQMQAIDRYAINVLEIPSLILMENAALRTIDQIDLNHRHSFAIFCGTGNNGGDGLAIARGLIALGKKVHVFMVGERGDGSEEFKVNYQALENLTEPIWLRTLGDLETLADKLQDVNTIIDCIFGIGINREIRGPAVVIIEQINNSRIYTISIDIPSGMNPDSGKSFGAVIDASEIICLQYKKQGLNQSPYVHCPIKVVPIGIPDFVDKILE